MGLFDKFKKNAGQKADKPVQQEPTWLSIEADPHTLYAPVDGKLVALSKVPDPVFSGGVLGEGCAIWPTSDVVYAPISGTVTAVMGHALGISGDTGIEALVHIGVDTVEMNGEGFAEFVAQNDHVRAGQPVLRFDRDKIKAAEHPDCVVVTVSNSADMATVEVLASLDATVSSGDAIVRATKA